MQKWLTNAKSAAFFGSFSETIGCSDRQHREGSAHVNSREPEPPPSSTCLMQEVVKTSEQGVLCLGGGGRGVGAAAPCLHVGAPPFQRHSQPPEQGEDVKVLFRLGDQWTLEAKILRAVNIAGAIKDTWASAECCCLGYILSDSNSWETGEFCSQKLLSFFVVFKG